MAKGTLTVRVVGDASNLKKALEDSDSALGKFSAKAARVGSIFTAALSAPILMGLNHAVESASALNETMSKSEAVFGKNASSLEKWAEGGAKAFGQSKQGALDAASTFGNLFVQLGVGTDEATGLSKQMVELASDFASFHNADITQVIEAQTAAFRGEYDALQRFVPTISAATVEQRALAMTGKTTTKELTAQEKALAVQKLMMEGAGKAAGDFTKTSGGLANSQRIAAAEAANAAAALGQKLLPVKLKLTQAVTSLIEKFASLSPRTQDIILKSALLVAAVGPLILGLAALAKGIIAISAAMTFLAANPVGLVIVALAALAAGLVIAWKTSETFRNAIRQAMIVAVEVVQWFVNRALDYFGMFINGAAKLLGWVPGLGPKLKQAAKAFEQFRDDVNEKLDGIQKNITVQIDKDKLRSSIDKSQREINRIAKLNPELAARMAFAGAGLGQALTEGVASGMVNRASLAYINSAASKLMGYTVAAARRFGEIRSPSQLFRRMVGLPISEGVALGIEDGQITVDRAFSETLDKLFKASGAVRAVVNEAHALGVQIPDEIAEGIAKGTIPVGNAMNAVMEAAGQIARQRGKEIADSISANLNGIMSGFGGASGLTGAKRALGVAEQELADALRRKSALPGAITRQEDLVGTLHRESRAVTAAEERAILQARKRVSDAEEKLEEVRDDGEAKAIDLRLAELDLVEAREALTEAQKASVAPTQRLSDAAKKLGELYEEQKTVAQRVKDAQDAVVESQLRLIDTQRQFEESQKRLIEQGEGGLDFFRRLAERAGLSKSAIDALARSVFDLSKEFGKVPDAPASTGGGGGGSSAGGGGSSSSGRAQTLIKRLSNPNVTAEYAARYRSELRDLGVPGYARGGVARGLAIVGEEGPELVNVGSPSRVHSAGETARMMGGTTVNITVNVPNYVGDKRDLTKAVADVLLPALKQVEKQVGPIPIRVRG